MNVDCEILFLMQTPRTTNPDLALYYKWLHVTITRYLVYGGLTISTFIIFRSNSFVASIIGLFVALYIGIAEYTIDDDAANPIPTLVPSDEL